MPNGVIREAYAALPETSVYRNATGRRTVNKILLGTWVGIVEEQPTRVRVRTAGPDGWVNRGDLRGDMGLKIFFIDVGQGDGCLIETPRRRILVDGGPNTNVRRYLRGWQYSWLLRGGNQVHIDTVFVSHFDADHYRGLTSIINDRQFTFGTVYHNGIARFSGRRADRPAGFNEDLGQMTNGLLRTSFDDLDDARQLLHQGGLQATFRRFLEAVVAAQGAGRLDALRRLTTRDVTVPRYRDPAHLVIEVLGPVPSPAVGGAIDWPWFINSSHTRNGHSLVLKFIYGQRTVLLGGDLNAESEQYLMQHWGNANPFRVDVAKGCHHGSSDFLVEFMAQMRPYATVISSGDNESYAHPRADALGAAGRYSRGRRPLVFSTELARSVSSGGDILYGMINLRTDGQQLVLAQMKEVRTGTDVWDSYEIP